MTIYVPELYASRCYASGRLLGTLLEIEGDLKIDGGYGASAISIHCERDFLEREQKCETSFEMDTDTAYLIAKRVLDCPYRLRKECDRFAVFLWFLTDGDGGRKLYSIRVRILIDSTCDRGILVYTAERDAKLSQLIDPLRGEGLVEVDKGLYMDERLAECLAAGGNCGEIRVEQRRDGNSWSYDVRVCNTTYEVSAPLSDMVRVVRVLDKVRAYLGVIADAARRLGASLQKLGVNVYCTNYDSRAYYAETEINILPVDGPDRLNVVVEIRTDNSRVLSRESHFFLHSLLCLARVLSRASRVQNRNARL